MNVTIWDNKGQTEDRYTILDNATGNVFGCSGDPFHPCGIGQFSHNVVERVFGHNWEDKRPKTRLKYACINYRADSKHLGKRVKFESLPEKVQQYIKQITE